MSSRPWSFEETRAHWNERFRTMRSFRGAPSTEYYRRSEIRLIERHLGDLRGKRFLKTDLWNEARNTEILFWVAEQGAEVFALDISDELLNEVRPRFQDRGIPATLIHSDIRDIRFPDNSFDLLYSMGTVEHVPDVQRAFGEFHRVLKPGGKAIVGVPNLLDPFLRPAVVKLLSAIGRYPYHPETAFTYGELRGRLQRAGFHSAERAGLLFMPGVLRMLDVFTWLRWPELTRVTSVLLGAFERVESSSPTLARYGYLVACVARKPEVG